jgi:hypothetical protein
LRSGFAEFRGTRAGGARGVFFDVEGRIKIFPAVDLNFRTLS